jgi:hypothetical protein
MVDRLIDSSSPLVLGGRAERAETVRVTRKKPQPKKCRLAAAGEAACRKATRTQDETKRKRRRLANSSQRKQSDSTRLREQAFCLGR